MPFITQYEPVQVTLQTDQVVLPVSMHTAVCLYLAMYSLVDIMFILACNSFLASHMQVRDIPCGTKGGVMITFEKIEARLLSCIIKIYVVTVISFLICALAITGC